MREGMNRVQKTAVRVLLWVLTLGMCVLIFGFSAQDGDTSMETSGMIIGINEDTQRAHIVRAALEALAYQVRDVYESVVSDTGMDIKSLHVDGGASQNHALMQFQADLLNIPVIRPYVAETTALGAAFMAGLATGVWESVDELKKLWREGMRFKPSMSERGRAALYDGWQEAVSLVMGWSNK